MAARRKATKRGVKETVQTVARRAGRVASRAGRVAESSLETGAATTRAAAKAAKKRVKGLTRAEKVMLQDQFTAARGEVSEKDVERLVRRGVREADALARATPGWKVNLASQVKLLFDMLRDWWRGDVSFPKATAFAIAAALLYFINPLDVFPDLIPVAGLLDDATVMAACIRLIQADLRAYCMDRDLELDDHGL